MKRLLILSMVLASCTTQVKDVEDSKGYEGMLTVNQINQISTDWINVKKINQFEGRPVKMKLPTSGVLDIPYSYKIWMSGSRTAPQKRDNFTDGETGVLFYGPWLLAHHYPNDIQVMNLQLDEEGFITNFTEEYIRGINIYGESTRISIPSDIKMDPNDTSLGINEKSGELYLYPLRGGESLWDSATELQFRHLSK